MASLHRGVASQVSLLLNLFFSSKSSQSLLLQDFPTAKMSIRVYCTSVSACSQTKKNQSKIFQYLDSKKIPYEALDISVSTDLRDEMRQKSGIEKALPPQIFNGDVYCGDATKFENAVEMENVEEFLQLK